MTDSRGRACGIAGLATLIVTVLGTACGTSTPAAPSPVSTPVAAPTLTCPGPMDVTTTGTSATVTWDAPAARGGTAPVSVSCTPASDQPFPLGTTEVRCTATDGAGQVGSCAFPVSVSRLPTLSKTRFVAFGDSVTVGIVATENPAGDPFYFLRPVPNESYPSVLRQLLAARYGTQDVTVINEGRGGEKAVDAAGRAYSVIATHRPEVLLLLDGYNDLGLGDAGIGPGLTAVNDIVKIARFQGVQVLLATITPPNRFATRGLSNALITDFNDGLRSIARGENLVLVDLYGAMSDDPNRYNSDDGRHPNEAGYRKMAETFFEVIRRELEVR